MALETGNYIANLVSTNPPGTDPKSQGDDHLRLIKGALLNCFSSFAGSIIVTGTDGGAVNAYTVTTTPAQLAYTERMIVLFSPTIQNTGASTLNVSGLGVKDIKDVAGNAVISADLVVGAVYAAMYIGTVFRLIAPTKNYIDQLSFSSSLPAQTGNDYKFLQTIGGSAQWQFVGIERDARTSNTALLPTDNGNLIGISSGQFVQTFSSTLPANWWCYIRNQASTPIELEAIAVNNVTSTTSNSIAAGTTWTIATGLTITAGDLVTVRRTSDLYNQRIVGTVSSYNSGTGSLVVTVSYRIGSGTFTDWTITTRPSTRGIDSLATFVMYPNEQRLIQYDGTALRTLIQKEFYYIPSASEDFVWPPGVKEMVVDLIGGGGGGGSGRRGAAGTNRNGGAPGGAPSRALRTIIGVAAGTKITFTKGAGGTGGAAQTANDTNGANGTAGGNTSFGSYLTAYGGAAGLGGGTNINGLATSGSGVLGVGTSSTTSVSGGGPSSTHFGGIASGDTDNVGDGGGGCFISAIQFQGGNSDYGGASSGSGGEFTVSSTSGSSMRGVSAGGVGGWITPGDAMPAIAGTAGLNGTYTVGGGAAGGTCGASPTAGTAGAAATDDNNAGNSGGGGGSSITAAGAIGGAGGAPGGAGGGGGASLNGSNSGAGGAGAAGKGIFRGRV